MLFNMIRSRFRFACIDWMAGVADPGAERIRLNALAFVNFVALLYLVFFGIKVLFENTPEVAAVNIFVVIIVAGNFFLLHQKRFERIAVRLFMTIVGLQFLFLLFSNGSQNAGHLWIFSYPIFAMLFLKQREGTLFTTVFLALVILLLALPVQWGMQYTYSFNYKLRIVGMMALIFIVALTYEQVIAHASATIVRRNRKYFSLYNNVPIGLYSASATGDLIDANQALAVMFGCANTEEFLRSKLFGTAVLSQTVSQHMVGGELLEGITRKLKRADGTVILVREIIRRIELGGDTSHEEQAVFEGCVEDITRIKDIEESKELYKNDLLVLVSSAIKFGTAQSVQDVYRLLVEQAAVLIPEAITVISEYDSEGCAMTVAEYYAHPGLANRLAAVLGNPIGMRFPTEPSGISQLLSGELVVLPGALRELLAPVLSVNLCSAVENELNMAKVCMAGIAFRGELYGSTTFFLRSDAVLSSEKRDVLETLCSQAAVMLNRLAAESQLHKEHLLSLTLLETIPIPVFFKDRTGYYLACNGAMARFAEKSREELIGKSALNWAGPLTARELDSQDTEVFASEGIRTYELELSDSTGTPRSIRIIKGCVRNEHGEATGLVGAYVDITQERNLLQAMSAARHEAEKAVRIKCDLMSAVSHEMRTPLTAIVLLAEAQLGGSEFPGDENLLLHEASTRLLGIVENIITLTGIESGMLHCENASFSATEMINAVYAKFLPTAREKQLSFVCDIDTGIPPRLQGDRAMIEMVLRHILSNAFKFTTVGSVTLSARMSTGEGDAGECMSMLYTVSDTGCGIASDLMEHLFDPFWQEDQSATRAYGGLGLGLPIVKRLVHSMGGRVEISALTEAGTMVRVFVPLTLAPESASENAKEAE